MLSVTSGDLFAEHPDSIPATSSENTDKINLLAFISLLCLPGLHQIKTRADRDHACPTLRHCAELAEAAQSGVALRKVREGRVKRHAGRSALNLAVRPQNRARLYSSATLS